MRVLTGEMVVLKAQAAEKEDAIQIAGEVLVKAGCVAPTYIAGMQTREQVMSTYLGQGIAIPHGLPADLKSVYRTGISVIQVPEGVEWGPGERAHLVIGLASVDEEHHEVLGNLVTLLQEPETISELIHTADPMVIVERLTRRRSETRWN